MRLLHVVHQFLPDYVGGTEVYVADLAKRLRQRGHEIRIFTGGPERGRRAWDGLEVETVPGGVRGPGGPARTFLTTFGNRGTERSFSNLLARFRPDAVHFHHLLGLSGRLIGLAHRAGVPSCYTLHDYWFMCPKTQLIDHRGQVCGGPRLGVNCGRCAAEKMGNPIAIAAAPVFALRERLVKQAIASAEMLLAPSEFIAGMAARHGLPAGKLRRVEFGVADLTSMPHRAAASPLRVTYLGSVEHSKGVHVLVEASRGLRGIQVSVYGSLGAYPAYASELKKQAKGAPVRFMGPAPRESIPQVLAETDILAVPSLWYENSPMVIAEAHAAGVPVLASGIGALPERVGNGGLLFPPGDVQALSKELIRLIRGPGLLDRLRDNVKSQVRPARSDHVEEMEAIYRELADRA